MVFMSTIYSFERRPYLRELEVEILDVREESGDSTRTGGVLPYTCSRWSLPQ